MSGRILIIDSMATNRIVLKAKIIAAQYDVETCATCEEAYKLMESQPADLLLVNLADPTEDRHAFCRSLRQTPATAHLPIISVGVADTARTRFAALDAGADDVLPRPLSDVLLLARIRSLLRRSNVAQDLQLRDGTSRALGFEEDAAPRLAPPRVSVLSAHHDSGMRLLRQLQKGLSTTVRLMTSHMARATGLNLTPPDLYVIDGTDPEMTPERLYHLVSDLNARIETRMTSQLVVVPKDRPDMASLVLDLGAHDVIFADVTEPELTLRAESLVALKTRQDSLRARVRSGLHAAVTDPLTGLFNRRYAETHLKRISEQAHASRSEYALMVLDIDHFKMINDTYGHASGDAVLTELSNLLRNNFRGIDLIARIGGEEFLIVMPNTSPMEAELAAERLCEMVQSHGFEVESDTKKIPVTVSVGVAVDLALPSSNISTDSLFAQADAALYDAKSSGRNTIVMSQAAA